MGLFQIVPRRATEEITAKTGVIGVGEFHYKISAKHGFVRWDEGA